MATILEDICDYNHWVKVKDVLKTEAELKSELATTRNNMVMGANAEFSSAVPVVHQLQSGLVGPEQSFYIPVNQMMTAGGFALQVELTLADDVQVCYSTDSGGCDL